MATSRLQKYTGKELRRRFSKYGIVENTRPDWLISSKGERLELDFYLERLGIAVEVQGSQHFEFTPVFHADEYDFQEQVRRDKEKLEICQRTGVDLLYVCQKSDVEVVLTACYDVLSFSEESVSWKQAIPSYISVELETERRKLCKAVRRNVAVSERLIARWQSLIRGEYKNGKPRPGQINRCQRKIEQHKKIIEDNLSLL